MTQRTIKLMLMLLAVIQPTAWAFAQQRVTIVATGQGSVVADKPEALAGETVTLTVSADEGWRLKKGSLLVEQVTDSQSDSASVTRSMAPAVGSFVAVSRLDDNSYTFVMPANDVEISAVFSDNPVARPTITYDAPNNKVTLSLTKQPTGEDAGFASNAKIYYTTDGTDPTTSATKQESETDVDITVTKDITIIKAVGVSSTGNFSVEVSQEVSLVRYLTVSKEWTVFCSPETFSVPD